MVTGSLYERRIGQELSHETREPPKGWPGTAAAGPSRQATVMGGIARPRRPGCKVLQVPGEAGDGRSLEHGAHRQLDVKQFADAEDDADDDQRVAAKLEEIVMHADLLDPEHI